MRIDRQTELAVIAKIRRAAKWTLTKPSSGSLTLGIGDDAALFRPSPGHQIILTCDWFLEGTHFLKEKHPSEAVGWKCLARAVSDIAAMGGAPQCFLLSLALPASATGHWLDGFLNGLRRASRRFKCVLAGGDTTRTQRTLINVTVIGEVPSGGAALRSGARAGDILYVSGHLGEAELGLRRLRRSKGQVRGSDPRIQKHLYPEPRLALSQWLAKKRYVTAMMDLSDGLSLDLARLCAASGVGARVEAARIPPPPISAQDRGLLTDPLPLSLHGGDDYELLFTVPSHSVRRIPKSFQGVPLTAIGEITRHRGVRLVQTDGTEKRLIAGGWDPFR
jgi:thiamine-monophosphate kinase